MAKIDQAWYERAADIVNGGYSTPEARMEVFNDLWCAYLFVLLQLKQSREGTLAAIRQTFETAIEMLSETENKEMIKNGTNEAQATAADAEQLG